MGRQRNSTFYNARYARQPRRARTIAYRRHQAIAELIVGESVLDLGCGVAMIADLIGNREYLGIDFSREAIEASRRVVSNPLAEFIVADVTTVPIERLYDTVLLIEILEHLKDPRPLAQRAIERATKRVIATVPRDMRGPAHVKPCWTADDLKDLLGPLAVCKLFGGPDDDWWWLAIKEVGRT